MRCFKVLVHGRVTWLQDVASMNMAHPSRPHGFYAHRHVLAIRGDDAIRKAIEAVRNNLERQTGWVANRIAEVELEAEEVTEAPLWKAFLPQNLGHTFYD